MNDLISEQEKSIRTIENINAPLFYCILEEQFGFCKAQKIEIIEKDFYTHFIFKSYDLSLIHI